MLVEAFQDELWKVFAAPILNLDSTRFLEAAEAINRILKLQQRGFSEDHLRHYLLAWKRSGKHPTMVKLKENWGKQIMFDEHQVYRIAKEIGLRLRTNKKLTLS